MQGKNTIQTRLSEQPNRFSTAKPAGSTPAVPTAAVRRARVRQNFNRKHEREKELTAYENWQMERYGNFLPDG